MVKKLSKAEFMQLATNHYYNRKSREREKLNGADTHAIENVNKVKDFRRKKKL